MAKIDVAWHGLDSFMTELEVMAANLTVEAGAIMRDRAQLAALDIRDAYPERTGTLKNGVTLIPKQGVLLEGVILTNKAPHAWLFEHGSRARHTDLGADRGSMPARPTFTPIAEQKWREAVDEIKQLLLAKGATKVTDHAA